MDLAAVPEKPQNGESATPRELSSAAENCCPPSPVRSGRINTSSSQCAGSPVVSANAELCCSPGCACSSERGFSRRSLRSTLEQQRQRLWQRRPRQPPLLVRLRPRRRAVVTPLPAGPMYPHYVVAEGSVILMHWSPEPIDVLLSPDLRWAWLCDRFERWMPRLSRCLQHSPCLLLAARSYRHCSRCCCWLLDRFRQEGCHVFLFVILLGFSLMATAGSFATCACFIHPWTVCSLIVATRVVTVWTSCGSGRIRPENATHSAAAQRSGSHFPQFWQAFLATSMHFAATQAPALRLTYSLQFWQAFLVTCFI